MASDPAAAGYLAQLRSLATGALEPSESWIGKPPPFAGAPRIRRTYDRETLRKLLLAIRRGCEVRTRYVSFSEGSPPSRVLAPHALGFDGQRWHIRAFCHRSNSFRDFVIGRLSHVTPDKKSVIDPEWDIEWTRQVKLILKPNPKLPNAAREAIERDHQMQDGTLEVSTSVCSSYYLESQLDLDIDPASLPPQRLQLVLANGAHLRCERDRAKADAKTLIDKYLGVTGAPAA